MSKKKKKKKKKKKSFDQVNSNDKDLIILRLTISLRSLPIKRPIRSQKKGKKEKENPPKKGSKHEISRSRILESRNKSRQPIVPLLSPEITAKIFNSRFSGSNRPCRRLRRLLAEHQLRFTERPVTRHYRIVNPTNGGKRMLSPLSNDDDDDDDDSIGRVASGASGEEKTSR